MRIILTIFLLFNSAKAQTTIPCYLVLLDTTHYWNYYNKNGSLAWGTVKGYDAGLIPAGGKAVKGNLVNTTTITMDGYKVVKDTTITYLDKNRVVLDKKYISAWPFDIPVNGFK